ncbi:beta strand repeat-containing protein [Candidatus Endoriftia persephonae]|jgi:hypothetical protein|uniref:DUF5011 domain-containing protein n=2 Tax=Gammaproteobacteria TaxID=1236 RepID=A0A9J6ZSZ6_9GAMM|nr:immunoglobulin-like domain-containing protein [Candidatus Endoriftia persephone]EGW53319.1 putative hyalin [endosymbiont of Tevnia jerichonana (vent Tica)]USF86147.1 DUF5011 domain-containing protein [Candidatus Endoriftia persephone]
MFMTKRTKPLYPLALLLSTLLSGCDLSLTDDLATNTAATAPDNDPPAITLLGATPLTVEAGNNYIDSGATANDAKDGDISANIVLSGSVDTTTPGSYILTYNVADAAGNNAAAVTRTVVVADTTAPVISLTGDATQTINLGSSYSDPGASATDSLDGDISSSIVVSGTVNTSAVGTYTLTYNVADAAGNAATAVTRTVNVVLVVGLDSIPPVITLNGASPQTVSVGTSYSDPGATANDDRDGDISANISVSGSVNSSLVGSYSLSYNVSDAAGNAATTVTRTVNVVDTTAPVIALNGGSPLVLEAGTTPFSDPGAIATDNVDGNISANITVSGSVNRAVVGVYSLTYSVSDAAGNNASATRSVTVNTAAAPVITLSGDNPLSVRAGDTFSDPGASAIDNVDGDLSGSISVSGTVDTSTVGSYTLTYTVTDAAGNSATQTRTVNVTETTAPVITITGDNPLALEAGTTAYSDPGASANDNVDGDITGNITTSGSVDRTTAGTYTITYTVNDAAGNTATSTRTVNISAATAPVITLSGDNPMTIAVGASFTDPGASANDNFDGDVSGSVTISGTVDTNTLGDYTLTYQVTDAAGNTSTQSRTVSVTDQTAPVIVLAGDNPQTVDAGSSYSDPGASASDNIDGDISANISVSGSVNTAVLGNYTLTYNVSDAAGNAATAVNRTVTVADLSAPVITLSGSDPMTVAAGSVFTDPGASASDIVEGDLSASIVTTGSVNTAAVGSYTLTYNVSDSAGNAATAVTRTVNVTDQTAPTITLSGDNPMGVALGGTFTDPGASASDAIDGDISANVTVSGTVDTNTLGSYTLTYNVSDSGGNAATPVTRTVEVKDLTGPVITLNGDNPQTVSVGATYSDPGATAIDNVDGDLSGSITASGSVNTAVAGIYTLTYSVTDAAGNSSTLDRTVVVADQPPTLVLIGDNPFTLEGGTPFTDPGSTATDDVDGDISANVVVTGSVNNAVVGSYTLTYNVTDSAGNTTTATRTVNVVDTTIPVITLIGANPMVLTVNVDTYSEPGATASDTVDGDLSGSLVIGGDTVDTNTIGSYSVTYDVTDASGNAATQLTRTVQVTAPAPDAPINVSMSFSFKQISFSWDASAGADHYRLMVNPDGASGFSVVSGAEAIAGTSHTIDIATHLQDWANARYMVEACNAGDTACSGSAEQATSVIDSISSIGYFKAGNAGLGDNFGLSVAISADGSTMAVGAPLEDSATTGVNSTPDEAAADAGAVYVYVFSAGSWSQQAYIKASNTGAGDEFGTSLALSADGNTLAVGTIKEDSGTTGVSVDSSAADELAVDAGAVYLFTRSGTTWSEQAYIKASNTEAGDAFGASVALSADGNTLAVGATLEDSDSDVINAGEADNAADSAGAAYVFTRSATTWSQQAYIKSDHSKGNTTYGGDLFGTSIALSDDGNILAVGAIHEDADAAGTINAVGNSGAVFVYTRAAGTWSLDAMVKAANAGSDHLFGSAVALGSDSTNHTLAVGATGEDSDTIGVDSIPNPAASNAGAAYTFTRPLTGGAWTQQAYIKASTASRQQDKFGYALDLSSDGALLAVGMPWEDRSSKGVNDPNFTTSTDSGAVFVYGRSGSNWSSQSYVKASNTGASDKFGYGLSISGDGSTLAVGAYWEDSAATGINPAPGVDASAIEDIGAVYLY